MTLISKFIALCFLGIITAAYVAVNIVVANFLLRNGRNAARRLVVKMRREYRVQLRAISTVRIWTSIGLYLSCSVVLIWLIQTKLSLFSLTSVLLGHIFIVSAVTLSLMFQISFLRTLWQDVAVKLGLSALPIYFGFVAKGYASIWVEELLGTSAANAGHALFAAFVFLLCLIAATLLTFASVLAEIFVLVTTLSYTHNRRTPNQLGWAILAFSSLFATIFGSYAATTLPGSRAGQVVLAAIAFEFDAAPANYCEITAEERKLASGDEPTLKALHLSSSQEKALLVRRSPTLFSLARLSDLRNDRAGNRRLLPMRVIECYKP